MKIRKLFSALLLFTCCLFFVVTANYFLSASQAIPATNANQSILNTLFQNTNGTFVLYDLKNNQYIHYNEERSRQRFSPYSTFKIPNSIIALETGVVQDENVITPYAREKYPPQDWWPTQWQQDNNLRSAFQSSVVWYYKEIAKKVGQERYRQYLQQFQYGNEDVSVPIDQFWLGGSLKISPNEEVEFLRKFYKGQFAISERTHSIVKDIFVLDKTNSYTLSGKTGSGTLENGDSLGWFVGYLEKPDNVYFFAINVEGKDEIAVDRDKRVEFTKHILQELGLLDGSIPNV